VKTLFLAGCAFVAICASAHAAPKMLTSQCTETPDHIRTCLAPGEAPWSAERPHRASPVVPGAAMPVIPQQQVPTAASEAPSNNNWRGNKMERSELKQEPLAYTIISL